MKRRTSPSSGNGRRAFSLVELLVVMLIISLLMGLLLPTFTNARIRAKETRTRSLLRIIDTGLGYYIVDSIVGGEYPPSLWLSANGDPYGAGSNYFGAQTLLWALAGADLLGTPGFKTNPPGLSDTGGLYEVDATDGPAHYRAGPFINISKAPIRKPAELALGTVTSGNPDGFVIADQFNMPVLYFKPDNTGKYQNIDNFGFLHQAFTGTTPPISDPGNFERFTRNWSIEKANRPHNQDSYILISAGSDKVYGTADDITNYNLAPDNYDY